MMRHSVLGILSYHWSTAQSSSRNLTEQAILPEKSLSGTTGDDVLVGSLADDIVRGLSGNDTLFGKAGDDTLDGGIGADWLNGGKGNDLLTVDDVQDVLVEDVGAGNDTAWSLISYTLPTNVENLLLAGTALSGSGNSSANLLVGNSADNNLRGGAGADTLKGGQGDDTLNGGSGRDNLNGGLGNDLFIVTDGDLAKELFGQGYDTVQSSVSFTLGRNIEELTLVSKSGLTGVGNSLDNRIFGASGSDSLFGLHGIDWLEGGRGRDSLLGGDGDDLVMGGNGGDSLLGGDGNDRLEGDEGSDSILGGGGDDLLFSGNGIDTLNGGVGNDSLYSLFTSGNKLLIGGAGNDLITAAGSMYPFEGKYDDTLKGGAGADTMSGGDGDDTYYVDSVDDVVHEPNKSISGYFGNDTVVTSLSHYVLGFFLPHPEDGLENLKHNAETDFLGEGNGLDNFISGNLGADTLIGNFGSDTLSGGSGADSLSGGADLDRLLGGTGKDTLTGGDQADEFVFSTPLGWGNVDLITDFVVASDRFCLKGSTVFSGLTAGNLAESAFKVINDNTGVDEDDLVLYDQEKGLVYFDADGSGDLAKILFAKVSPDTALTSSDFLVF